MIPVPGEAGLSRTRPPSNSPSVSCGIVFSRSATFSIDFRADSDALRIASATSFALPKPTPTLPSWSPATIRALKLKRRPPFTTFAQRLMNTTFSVVSPRAAEVLSVWRSRWRPPRCGSGIIYFLKFEAAFARRIGECFHFAVVKKTAAIEHDRFHFLGHQPLRDRFANLFGGRTVCRQFFTGKGFLRCRRGNDRALCVV